MFCYHYCYQGHCLHLPQRRPVDLRLQPAEQQTEAGGGAAGDHEDPAGRPQHQRRQHRGLPGELLQVSVGGRGGDE